MADRSDYQEAGGTRPGRARRLIAGLRITRQEEALLAVVRPFLANAGSEGELAYRLWRRGLEVTLAEAAGLGAQLPPGLSADVLASTVAQRLLLCMPLLRWTGKLALLGIESSLPAADTAALAAPAAPAGEPIAAGASDAIAGLGGNDFL